MLDLSDRLIISLCALTFALNTKFFTNFNVSYDNYYSKILNKISYDYARTVVTNVSCILF